MKTTQPESLDAHLARLTNWDGDAPDLWRRAIESARPHAAGPTSSLRTLVHRRVPSWALPTIAAASILIALVGIVTPSLRSARQTAARSPASDAPATDGSRVLRSPDTAQRAYSNDHTEWLPHHGYWPQDASSGRFLSPSSGEVADGGRGGTGPAEAPPAASAPGERHVVRKATVELTAPDVRVAFLKAGQLISEARGEYVQESALTGAGSQLQANLTLRVAADRLSAVLNDLRQLGTVQSERSDAQDVTMTVVDLEARLRNERRVEEELLALLDSRQDAPLKEILELRDSLARVRANIEQMSGQREHLSRLVSLATILVLIRAGDAPPEQPAGIGAYFAESLSGAWYKGVRILADTVAVLLGAIVGGLPWWGLIAAVVLVIRAARRRAAGSTSGRAA